MQLKQLARGVFRDARQRFREAAGLQRVRLANPEAYLSFRVIFHGDPARVRLGRDVCIFGPTAIMVEDGGGLSGARLEVCERTYIGEFNNIRSAGAPIVIGRDCLISQHITIVGTNHGTAPDATVVSQPWSGDGVTIGNDVWIGAGVTVLPGTRIGDGVVIAANSVVRGEVPPGSVIGGAPARELGRRQ